MSEYKALMLDVDGTLSPYSTTDLPLMPSKPVADAIRAAQSRISVGLATSRPLSKVQPIIRGLGLNGYSILSNGAQIISSVTLQTVWRKSVSVQALNMLFGVADKYEVTAYFSNFERNVPVQSLQQVASSLVADFFLDGVDAQDIEGVELEFAQIPDIAVHKLSSRWEGKFELSITHADATKESAIAEVARLLSINPDQIIGIGDGYNDIPLLMACGLKVAMGNAVEDLKAIANFIAPSVDEDGVKAVIEKFVL